MGRTRTLAVVADEMTICVGRVRPEETLAARFRIPAGALKSRFSCSSSLTRLDSEVDTPWRIAVVDIGLAHPGTY